MQTIEAALQIIRILNIDPAFAYPAVLPPGADSWRLVLRPTLRLARDEVTFHPAVSGGPRPQYTPTLVEMFLPGFTSGWDLAEWLASHGVLAIFLECCDGNVAPGDDYPREVIELAAAAQRVIHFGPDVRAWPPTGRDVVEFIGWHPGHDAISVSQVGAAVESAARRDGLFLDPACDFTQLAVKANEAATVLASKVQRAQDLQRAKDPKTPAGELFRPAAKPD